MKNFVAITLLLLSWMPPVSSHDGEDHGAPPPVVSQAVLPRAVAFSEQFEMVAVLEGKRLAFYLDRFSSNEPVVGARVEVEAGSLKAVASESSPGVYALDAASIKPGKLGLTVSIEAGENTDLLSATLEVAPPEVIRLAPGPDKRWAWLVAALLMFAAGGWLLIRRTWKGVK